MPAPVPVARALFAETRLSEPPTTEKTCDGPLPRLPTTRV